MKCAVCSTDLSTNEKHTACFKCRKEKKGSDKCVLSKEADCPICSKGEKKKRKAKAQSFDDSLLDDDKDTQSSSSSAEPSLQSLITTMSAQIKDLAS